MEIAISPITRALRRRLWEALVPPRDSSFSTSVIGSRRTESAGHSPKRIAVTIVIAANESQHGKD